MSEQNLNDGHNDVRETDSGTVIRYGCLTRSNLSLGPYVRHPCRKYLTRGNANGFSGIGTHHHSDQIERGTTSLW